MAQSVLGSLTLGYRPLWNRARALSAMQLYVHEDDQGIDGQHLLRTLAELWSAESPELLLSVRSRGRCWPTCCRTPAPTDPLIEVPLAWLQDAALRARRACGHDNAVRGCIASGPPPLKDARDVAGWFERRMLILSARGRGRPRCRQRCSRVRRWRRDAWLVARKAARCRPELLVDGVASRALADHALDQQGAWAVAGWPSEDVLHRYRGPATAADAVARSSRP